jgi:maleate cis-trans isomerase
VNGLHFTRSAALESIRVYDEEVFKRERAREVVTARKQIDALSFLSSKKIVVVAPCTSQIIRGSCAFMPITDRGESSTVVSLISQRPCLLEIIC